MERTFPTNVPVGKRKIKQQDDKKVNGVSNSPETRLSKTNTTIKFCLDQTIGAGVNTALFVYGMGMLKGLDFTQMNNNLQKVEHIATKHLTSQRLIHKPELLFNALCRLQVVACNMSAEFGCGSF